MHPSIKIQHAKTLDLDHLVHYQAKHKLSDLHLTSWKAPYFRDANGKIVQIQEFSKEVDPGDIRFVFSKLVPEKQWREYLSDNETNIVLDLGKTGRFRTNIFKDQHGIGVVMRFINQKVFTAEEYEIPKFFLDLTEQSSGLILITGKNNAGKTTFLVSLLDYIKEGLQK